MLSILLPKSVIIFRMQNVSLQDSSELKCDQSMHLDVHLDVTQQEIEIIIG